MLLKRIFITLKMSSLYQTVGVTFSIEIIHDLSF